MEHLTNPVYMQAVLRRHGFRFQKKYGQNFLMNEGVLQSMVDAAGVTKDDFILEIGPGMGTLTQVLSERAGKVLAVELDDNLIPILEDTLFGRSNVEVMHADILKVDLHQIAEEKNGGKPMKVAANLPYYITTPILMELLTKKVPMESVTVMVQKEVALRMQAGPGSKDYGALSLAIQYYTEPELVCIAAPDDFMPSPKVESAVIHLKMREEPAVTDVDEKALFTVIKAVFVQRRKTLLNSLSNGPGMTNDKQKIRDVICDMGWEETIRGEKLTLEEFASLTREMTKRSMFD